MKENKKLEEIRHSLAHLLAIAVLERFPKAKLAIGPTIENGFYYDFLLPRAVTESELRGFENRMRDFIKAGLPFSGRKITPIGAKKIFKGQKFKLELINEFQKEKKPLSVYITGTAPKTLSSTFNFKLSTLNYFVDLCRGGHVKNTKDIKLDAFKLSHIAGAYWRGNEKNEMLTRIYGLAFETKKELEDYIILQEEAKKRDHKKLGPELDLFTFSELVGPGLPLWTPKGTVLRNLLDTFVWELRKKQGYEQVDIPHLTKKDLYETSGHWDKFKDDLFKVTTRDGRLLAIKPMNCPHHTQIYARKPHSYRELPERYANTTKVYRDEQSGELAGISRVLSITQDDAHVFCRLSQTKDEFLKIWDIIHEFYGAFGFKLDLRVSKHNPKTPEKYLGDKKKWKIAESLLDEIVKEKAVEAEEGIGEAAFYGPKLDFIAKDSLGREWQVATIQLDMNMPERFDLTCINEEGKSERIVMIHAAIMGSIERFLSIIIEHFAGAFPLWLSPIQIAVLPVSEKHIKKAEVLQTQLKNYNMRTNIFGENETLGKRIREAELQKIPYIIILGDKEIEKNEINLREHGVRETKNMKVETFIKEAIEKIEKKT